MENQPNQETKPLVTPGRTEPAGDEDKVDLNAYNAVKADMHKYKEEVRKRDDELKAIKDQELKQKEQWKEYAQTKEKEAKDWETKYSTLSGTVQSRSKINAVRSECVKLGLVDAAVDDIESMEFKDVVVETTSTGRAMIHGAKAAAERLKAQKPHWFSDNRPPNVNPGSPEVKPDLTGKVTYEQIMALEAEGRKSGDMSAYRAALMKYKKQ